MGSCLSNHGIAISIFFLSALGSCFDRGDRYWSGKPQPIGIDFAATYVTAIYANSTSNFTTLAIVGNLPGNEYFDYMYAPYAKIKDWGNDDHVIVDDDDEDLPDETWLEKASVLASQWKKDFASWSCRRRWPVLMRRTMQRQFCFAEWEYPPQGPRSRYRHLLSQSRMNRLRNLMPKWFRSLKSKQMTKSKLIMYLVEYLEQIKQISLAEHGIKITSAIISRPSWMYSKYDDIFDEACLLAGIEVVEQPHSRVDMATKALSTDEGPVMVLDHGHYYLNIHRSTWDEYNKQYRQRGSMNLDYYGTTWVLKQLANRILWDYNRNATVEERGWSRTVENQVVVMQTLGARLQIKYRRDWPEDLEFEKRTVGVNLTDSTGFLRVLNMTGEDVRRVDKEYVEEISDVMLTGLWKHKEIHQYMRSLPNYEELKDLSYHEYKAVQADIVANVTAPPEIGSWIERVEAFMILDSGPEAMLLYEATQMAFGQSLGSGKDNSGTCVPTIETAARGAALRAMDWVGYWEGEERARLYWERFN